MQYIFLAYSVQIQELIYMLNKKTDIEKQSFLLK